VIGQKYYLLQSNWYWRIYYRLFGIPFYPYHLNYWLLNQLIRFDAKDRVVDLGCGDGAFLNQLALDFKCSGVGVDQMPERIDNANLIAKENNLSNQFFNTSLFQFNSSEKFTKAICLDVLEHVSDPEGVLKKAETLLENNGIFVIRTPKDQDTKYLGNKGEFFGYGVDHHHKAGYSESELRELYENNGFEVVIVRNHYFPLTQLMYEILEAIRTKSRFLHSLTWPFLYPLAIFETILMKNGRANGIYIVGKKIK
jgi:2-polyprenyl-3-methyl-5-hydroxy-6-metoxy-1,4-benzoquinol methylase